MTDQQGTYFKINKKRFLNKNSKNLVTMRCNIINSKNVMCLSIGVNVCDKMNLKDVTRLNVYIDKNNRNILMVKESQDDGYKLSDRVYRSNFRHFAFRYESEMQFKLSQTTIINHRIENNMLILDIKELKVNS